MTHRCKISTFSSFTIATRASKSLTNDFIFKLYVMRKLALMVMLLLASAGMKAQEKKWEHQVFISSGILFNRDDGSSETGLSAQLGYGLNHFLSEKFSLMPGIVLRYASDNGFKRSLEGADDDNFFFADIPLMALYHVSGHANGWVLGIGPVFSFALDKDDYYNDANPNDPLNGKSQIKTFGLGLQPSVTHKLGRFRLGVEGHINLTNMLEKYDRVSSSKHLHHVVASLYYRF